MVIAVHGGSGVLPGHAVVLGRTGVPGNGGPGNEGRRPRMSGPMMPVLLTVLGVAGCDGSGEPGVEARQDGSGEAGAGIASPVSELTAITRFQGLFTVDDGWSFIPCGEEPIPVEGPAIPDLLEVYDELVPDGAEGMFVDVLGQVRERDGRGWLEAMEIRRAHFEGFGCDDVVEARLEASGTEPFWRVSVEEGTVTWTTPSGERRFVHPGLELDESGSWAVRARTADAPAAGEPTLVLEAWPDPCRNQMSGAYSHLRVEVMLEGEVFQGCGVLGAAYEAGLE